MNYQDFPPALMILSPRLTKAGDSGSSVVGLNTTPLADGAILYCIENQLAYHLDKQSTAAPDGNLILAPLTGPGRWLAPTPPTPAAPEFTRVSVIQYRVLSDTLSFGTAGNVDLLEPVIPDAHAHFLFAGGIGTAGPVETFDPVTGIWTYTDASPATILVGLECSAGNFGGGVQKEWALGISVDGDLDGINASTDTSVWERGVHAGQVSKTDGYDNVRCDRYFNVGAGTTVKPVAVLFGLDAALEILSLTMTITRCVLAS